MNWSESEYGLIDLGDKHLNGRAKKLLKQFGDTPMESIPGSCQGWTETKAAYRFFENKLLTARKVIKPHRIETLNRIKKHSIVLLIQDTTMLNYSGQKERLLLQMPKAGFGEKLHEAILDGYETAKAWLNWPDTLPTALKVEEDCRNHHAEFILRTFIRYIIIEKATSKIVGRCAFPSFQANWAIPQFGISYFIRKDSQSKGYATEAAHAMAVLAFQTLKARKVEIYVDAENLASCRVPEKLNFKHEYTQKGG
ncbi:MAG: GNAT family N-acetyltransferase [Alphaproteobacteria bacterium]|nr:GNAT family N-acetyltransferase [Alphaproteobacteria bacterium]